MSTGDEEPYSTIFASLKHPIRRRILRMLSKQPMSFSEMIEVLGVSNSFLTYHLDNLGELIGKTEDGKYKLSSFGEAANATMTKVEDIPITAPHQSPETRTKKIVGRSVAIALGIICIVLVACIGGAITYYTSVVSDKDKTISSQNSQISSLGNQKNQLQTWLDGNETLLNQTQTNNTYLQKQIDSLNSNVTDFQNQVNNFQIGSTENSTIWVNNENANTNEKVNITTSENVTIAAIRLVAWSVYVPSAGYVSIRVSSNNTSTYVDALTYILNGTYLNETFTHTELNNTNIFTAPYYYQFNVGLGGTVVFPVLPTSWIQILVGSSFGEATLTVTITYYY
jgi:hypothetical protein